MNHYEMVCILDAPASEDENGSGARAVREEIGKVGGETENIESLGHRKLAHSIKGRHEGLYLISRFSSPPDSIAALRNNIRLNPAFIRALILRVKKQAPITIEEPGKENLLPGSDEEIRIKN